MVAPFQIEVCVEYPEDALLAEMSGATRVELNCGLQLDGLTPTLAACLWVKANCQIPVIAMLRPHNASFQYSPVTQDVILRDCDLLLSAGVDGIAYGAVDDANQLQLTYIRQVAELCGSRELVCHRAFDQLHDQRRGLEQLIDCGVRRVLTSGGAPSAPLGVDRLRELHEWADGRIEILPGCGVKASNAAQIVAKTGCTQLHGSFRGDFEVSPLTGLHPSQNEIRKVCQLVNGHSGAGPVD